MSDHQHRPAWERQYMDRVRGESRNIRVDVHIIGLAEIGALILAGFKELKQEIQTMSGQLDTDLAAQTAAVQALASEVTAGLAANAAAIQALKDQIGAGTPITPEQLTALEGNTTAIQAATDALSAALNPPPATP